MLKLILKCVLSMLAPQLLLGLFTRWAVYIMGEFSEGGRGVYVFVSGMLWLFAAAFVVLQGFVETDSWFSEYRSEVRQAEQAAEARRKILDELVGIPKPPERR